MKKKNFGNPTKKKFLTELPDTAFENKGIPHRCKFNFSFFDHTQDAGQNFNEWDHNSLVKLLEKLKHYSNENLEHWRHARCGAGGLTIYENYKNFPTKSEFIHPKHVPHNVEWARFRLEQKVRLIGFVLPKDCENIIDTACNLTYDPNTFFVVFLDRDHRFYNIETE